MKKIYFLLLGVFLFNITGCVLLFPSLYGYDFSPKGRHETWFKFYSSCVGDVIYNCPRSIDASPKDIVIDSKLLSNGYRETNRKMEYLNCITWYTYDPKTNIVISFDFIDGEFEKTKKNYGCRAYGAP